MSQSEAELETALIAQLQAMEYQLVRIDNEADMKANLKRQLEIYNQGLTLTPAEFKQVLNYLNTGTVFERAKILRDKFPLKRDSNEVVYLNFLTSEDWCRNEFQVTHQITMEGNRENRYDVTLLINGLPLVQIELKKRGAELKVAFHQINRYQRDSYNAGAGLFQYVQIFIISNGVNTKYFANNKRQPFEQTFFWTDKENNRLSDLHQFTTNFLKQCLIAKMIMHYTILHETDKILMVMRPYQVYATEALVNQVKNSTNNAFIWHTTGSGKTLTSFKASQIITAIPEVHKVLFVVDRKDLDYQTAREFNAFSKNCVDNTTHTGKLVSQLEDEGCKLIVTTLQKLHNAIQNPYYFKKIQHLRDSKIIFIFDECHRSQFGDTHRHIKKFFRHAQMFGFTGTPILKDNASGIEGNQQTTASLFGECLHKYLIVDAIRDENVLGFSIEYVGKYKRKDTSNEIDTEVENIDTTELLESEPRLTKIVDYILEHHHHKTKSPNFTAMFCVASVAQLIRYYDLFQQRQANTTRPLKIATIFSYGANEADPEANGLTSGLIPEEALEIPPDSKINKSSRDKLDEYIQDYNALFKTEYSSDSQQYYNYYQDIAKRVRAGEIDILLVVNMFLTGFDSPRLNTLYVDKNLKFHGLVQAFSRTNRILNEKKSQGNIVCFRNLKAATDEAITLFSNKDADAKNTVLIGPYQDYVENFNAAVEKLKEITPTVPSVDQLPSETEQLEFVIRFRELLRLKNTLTTFADFAESDLTLVGQEFEDYKSKYLDVHDKVAKKKTDSDKKSILEDVDFELALIHRDDINVAYILNLLVGLQNLEPEEARKRKQEIIEMLASETNLRSKRFLIQDFIDNNLPQLKPDEEILESFEKFWTEQKTAALRNLCIEEKIKPEELEKLISSYLFINRSPRNEEISNLLDFKPKILERKSIFTRITDKITEFIATFIDGMGGII